MSIDLHRRVLREILRHGVVVESDREWRIERLDETRNERLGALIDRRFDHLEPARTVFRLQPREQTGGGLAMRARGEDESEHHGLALVRAQLQLLAAIQINGQVARGPRNLRRGGEQRRRRDHQGNTPNHRSLSVSHAPFPSRGSSPSTLVTIAPLRRSSKAPSSPVPVTESPDSAVTDMAFHFFPRISR